MTKRILLVDDDEVNSFVVSEKIKKKGLDIVVLNDPLRFDEVFKEVAPCLVILDLIMPNTSGLELLEKIREKYNSNELPVIIMTSRDEPLQVIDALESGANDYIAKPINIEVATCRIKVQLAQVELVQQLLEKKQLEAINAMVVTYNHEINNPLQISLGCLHNIKRGKNEDDNLQRLEESLMRIRDMVLKIREVSEGDKVEYANYAEKDKIIKA